MRASLPLVGSSLLLVTLLPACQGRPEEAPATPPPTTAERGQAVPLTAEDVRTYLAVRSKALQQVEDALNAVETSGGDVLGRVQELSVAEREAARSLGVDWRHFTVVREQVGRLFTAQRQKDDQRLLAAELGKARQDLEAQLQVAHDPASRQFLEAQLKALAGQTEKLDKDTYLTPAQADEMKLLESARAEIAILQGRQDKVARRLQELLQRAATAATRNRRRPRPGIESGVARCVRRPAVQPRRGHWRRHHRSSGSPYAAPPDLRDSGAGTECRPLEESMRYLASVLVVALISSSGAAAGQASPRSTAGPASAVAGPATDVWAGLRFLVGEWAGEGSGRPGAGAGTFTFRFDLDERILIRRDHSEYPASPGREATTHEALMITYPAPGASGLEAIYFDGEGHVIRYLTSTENGGRTIVFLSEAVGSAPRFRLTYDRVSDDVVDVSFEIAPPGDGGAFKVYVAGRSHRVGKG